MRYDYKVGDRVLTKTGYVGTITHIYESCPQSNYWLSIQTIPVLAEHVRTLWYSIKGDKNNTGEIVTHKHNIVSLTVN